MTATADHYPKTYSPPASRIEIAACKLLFRFMLNSKHIRIAFPGNPSEEPNYTRHAEFVLAPPNLSTTIKMMLAPNLWIGESFIEGNWYLQTGNLADFLHVCKRDAGTIYRKYYEVCSNIKGVRHYLEQFLLNRYYSRKVRKHYDVDSRIFEMILDDEMVYTCAFFSQERESLSAAQQNKIAQTISRMNLQPYKPRVLDIGCGWGATARALVKVHAGVEVCGLSISKNQIEWAKQKDMQSLSDAQTNRIEYRLEDYLVHERSGFYDAVSVVGMLEHVGLGGYKHFFRSIYRFLKPRGTAVVHTIVSPMAGIPTNAWIDKHVFTGGYAPSLSELVNSIEHHPFRISEIHVYPPAYYKKTIECWIENYKANLHSIRGYLSSRNLSEEDVDRFTRTWIFYLSAVRNMFLGDGEPAYQVVQACINKM